MILKRIFYRFIYNGAFTTIGKKVDEIKRRAQRSDFITKDEQDPYFLMREEIDNNISLYSKLADKAKVKSMMNGIVSTPDTYIEYDGKNIKNMKSIPTNSKVVIKSNNGAGFVKIVNSSEITDKLIKKYYSKFYRSKFYGLMNAENQYKGISYKIIVEEHIGVDLLDYKIHYFNNGYTIYSIFSESDPSIRKVSDAKFNIQQSIDSDDKVKAKLTNTEIKTLEEMKSICVDISKAFNIKYARYDFYYVDKKIYLGEITFSHGGGNLFKKEDKHKKGDIYKYISNF